MHSHVFKLRLFKSHWRFSELMPQAPEGASVHCQGQAAGLVQQVGKAHRSLTQNTRAAISSCAHRPCVALILYQHRSRNNVGEQTRPLAALEGWHSKLWLRWGRETRSETPLSNWNRRNFAIKGFQSCKSQLGTSGPPISPNYLPKLKYSDEAKPKPVVLHKHIQMQHLILLFLYRREKTRQNQNPQVPIASVFQPQPLTRTQLDTVTQTPKAHCMALL